MAEVRIRFRDRETGEEAEHVYETSRSPDDDVDDEEGFYWTDGNGACDCERLRVLLAALGRPDPRVACGSSRVVIVAATFGGHPRLSWADSP